MHRQMHNGGQPQPANPNRAGPSSAASHSQFQLEKSAKVPTKKRKRRPRARRNAPTKRSEAFRLQQAQQYDDLLGKNLDEASYEELLAKYESIQRKLAQLNNLDKLEQPIKKIALSQPPAQCVHRERQPQDVDERFHPMPAASLVDNRFCQVQQKINPIDPRFVQVAPERPPPPPTATISVPSTSQETYLRPRSALSLRDQTTDQTKSNEDDTLNDLFYNYRTGGGHLKDEDMPSDDEFLSATSESPRSPLSQTNNHEQNVNFYRQSQPPQDRPYSPGDSLVLESPTLTISTNSSEMDGDDDVVIVDNISPTCSNISDLGPGYDAASCDMDISELSNMDTDSDENNLKDARESAHLKETNQNHPHKDHNLYNRLQDDDLEKISPDSPSESEDLQNESPNKKRLKIIPESEDEQGVDEAIMRAQLLISEVSRRLNDEKQSEIKPTTTTVVARRDTNSKPSSTSTSEKPKPFIIQIGCETSSDEEEDTSDTISSKTSHQHIQMSTVQEFLKEARENCEQMISSGRTDKLIEPRERVNSTIHDAQRYEIQKKEHSTSQDVLLRKKELKVKLIKAGLIRNDANLDEMRHEVAKVREKMRKFKAHAHKLRARYLEAAKIARASIQEFKMFEEKLINQEKHINAERLQLTKLEDECKALGKSVVGQEYKLPGSDNDKNRNELASRLKSAKKLLTARLQEMNKHASPNSPAGDMRVRALSDISSSILQNQGSDLYERIRLSRTTLRSYIEWSLSARQSQSLVPLNYKLMYKPIKYIQCRMLPDKEFFISDDLQTAINNSSIIPGTDRFEIATQDQTKKEQRPFLSNGSSLLSCLATTRLESRYQGNSQLTSWSHAHNIYPSDYICNADLLGSCQDKNCLYQHKSKYLMSDVDKLVDLLSYRPSIAGFKFNPDLSQEENYNVCRTKLRQFAQNLLNTNKNKPIELIAENLIKWLRCTSNESDIIVLTRQLPKTSHCDAPSLTNQKAILLDENHLRRLAGRVEFVPYAEYEFNFEFMIQDDFYRLKHSKISKISEIDPEMSIKFRFFAEGRPISTELETTLEGDPHNVQLWLKLAYHNLIRNPSNKAENVDRSLNVLSRAIEANPNEPELWETYLILYANRVPRPKESDKMDINNICELAIRKCPTISMYRIYLSLTSSIRKKLTAAKFILTKLMNDDPQDTASNLQTIGNHSQHIVEVVLFICNIYYHLGQNSKAIEIANKAFSIKNNKEEGELEEDDDVVPNVSKKLHPRDLIFARTCTLYWKIYGRLPETRIEPHGFSLPKVLSTSPSIIFVDKMVASIESLKSIMDEDFPDYELIELNQSHPGLDESHKNLLVIRHNGLPQEESQLSMREQECFALYNLAKTYYIDGNLEACYEKLYNISSNYGNTGLEKSEERGLANLRKVYEELLCLDEKDLFRSDLQKIVSPNKRSIILWMCYILIGKICNSTTKQMKAIYNESINSCSTAMIDQEINFTVLIYDYLKFLVQNISDLTSYQQTLDTVRHCCVTIPVEEFQIHIIELLLTIVSDPKTKLNLLFEFCTLLPTNAALINWTLRMALTNDAKGLCLKLVDYLLFEKKSHIVYDEWFWVSALSLTIDDGDHLKIHRIFRLAIGNQPYSVKLWKMMRAYERSVNHSKHMELLDGIVSQKLHLPMD